MKFYNYFRASVHTNKRKIENRQVKKLIHSQTSDKLARHSADKKRGWAGERKTRVEGKYWKILIFFGHNHMAKMP